jgi:hypothetical protein
MMVLLWNGTGEGVDTNLSSPLIGPSNQKTVQDPSCDFEVEISEGDFCVIRRMVHDIDLQIRPISGVCEGSVAVGVSGFPAGVTHTVLPSPKINFTRDTAIATVRIDTAGMTLQEMATSSLTFTASAKGITRKTKAEMTVDLPSFDFDIKLKPARLLVSQEEIATTTVNVRLLGAACKSAKPITLSLNTLSLPSTIHHDFSSTFVTPPGVATLLFKASSGSDTGIFKATVVGCCVGEGDEEEKKTTKIALNLLTPDPPDGDADHAFDARLAPESGKVYSMEEAMEMDDLPEGERKRMRKDIKDETEKGYAEMPEEEIQASALFAKRQHLLSMDQVLGVLTFDPVSIKGTPFEQFHLEGVLSYSNIDEVGPITSVGRVFTIPSGHRVELSEHDLFTLGQAGGMGPIIKELFNENLNGTPAMLSVRQSPSGHAVSAILWETPTTFYELKMEGNVRKNGQYEFLLELARSILANAQ